MGIPRFFRTPEHRRYHYEPVFYDERKEKLEERIQMIEQEYGIKPEDQPARKLGRGSFSSHYRRNKKAQRYSNTRLIVIVGFLLFISYYLFFA